MELEDTESDDTIHSTKRPLEKKLGSAKRRKEDQAEDILIKKAIDYLDKPIDSQGKDADDIFGQFVTSELRSIKDDQQKRIIKFKIQSLLYTSLVSQPAMSPPMIYNQVASPGGAVNNHLFYTHQHPSKIWENSRSPTPISDKGSVSSYVTSPNCPSIFSEEI